MKLGELFEDKNWEQSYLHSKLVGGEDPKLHKAVRQLRADPEHAYIDSGSNAYVGRSTSQHELDNVTRLSSSADGNVAFLEAIFNTPEIQGNPFLPKVRSVKGDHGSAHVVVERLYSYESNKLSSPEMLLAWWNRIAVEHRTVNEISIHSIPDLLDRSVGRPVRSQGTIKDKQLLEAINFITSVQTQHRLTVDIHTGNLMWRVTGTMPQLVIVDPLV